MKENKINNTRAREKLNQTLLISDKLLQAINATAYHSWNTFQLTNLPTKPIKQIAATNQPNQLTLTHLQPLTLATFTYIGPIPNIHQNSYPKLIYDYLQDKLSPTQETPIPTPIKPRVPTREILNRFHTNSQSIVSLFLSTTSLGKPSKIDDRIPNGVIFIFRN